MNVIVLGAGGHAKVVIEAIRASNSHKIVGLVDPSPSSQAVLSVPVLGNDEILPRLRAEGLEAIVVALGSNSLRERIGRQMQDLGFHLPSIIHPSALVSPSARIGQGTVIMARAVVGTEVVVEDLVIINTGALVDHDGHLGTAAHVAPGCALAGNVKVGERTLVGVGSAVRPGTQIGRDAIVGAGSAVVANVPDKAKVGGAPARTLPERERS